MKPRNPERPDGEHEKSVSKEREDALWLLLDFDNHIRCPAGALMNSTSPEEQAELWKIVEQIVYPIPTPEELYADTERWGPNYLPTLLRGAPAEIAKLNEIVGRINNAIKAKELEDYRASVNEGRSVIESAFQSMQRK